MATSSFDIRPDSQRREVTLRDFFERKLYRELSQLFKWDGLPEELPYDYMEKALIHQGKVMFFYDQEYGNMALACYTDGVNVYGKPINARAIRFTTEDGMADYSRLISYRYKKDLTDKNKVCVVIENMYGGEPMVEIVEFYAQRLAMLQQAFDTNTIWQNLPPIFTASSPDMVLSIKTMFSAITEGKPWVILDKEMLVAGKGIPVEYIDVKNKLADIYDAMNEIYGSFKETVGINSPGADKKERLLTDEVNANNQSIQTCLQIMLSCREVACEEIKKVFGLDITVSASGSDNEEIEEDEEDGSSDDGTQERSSDE